MAGRQVCLIVLVMIALAASIHPSPAVAKRVALVVGNDAYQSLAPLKKAVNDARAVRGVLEELGFKVISGENQTRRDLNRRLSDLERAIEPGDQVFVFYAGHGVAIGAENYLLPVDMPLPQGGDEGLVRNEGHAADSIIRAIQGKGAATTFVVLDRGPGREPR